MSLSHACTFFGAIALTIAVAVLLGAGGTVKSPTGTAPDRYIYYPGTEPLKKDEIRLIALGTGMPAARRSQAATCWLLELGNGDGPTGDVVGVQNDQVAAIRLCAKHCREKVALPFLRVV